MESLATSRCVRGHPDVNVGRRRSEPEKVAVVPIRYHATRPRTVQHASGLECPSRKPDLLSCRVGARTALQRVDQQGNGPILKVAHPPSVAGHAGGSIRDVYDLRGMLPDARYEIPLARNDPADSPAENMLLAGPGLSAENARLSCSPHALTSAPWPTRSKSLI